MINKIIVSFALVVSTSAIPALPANPGVPVEFIQQASKIMQASCVTKGFAESCSDWLAAYSDGMPIDCEPSCYEEFQKSAIACTGTHWGPQMEFFGGECAESMPTPPPTVTPTEVPTSEPSYTPTEPPTTLPPTTDRPTHVPTRVPTEEPTPSPSHTPTEFPTRPPTRDPTPKPSQNPTRLPTRDPTRDPTEIPTPGPTPAPSPTPTELPTRLPTEWPTELPSAVPTPCPTATDDPTEAPTYRPTVDPTEQPSRLPSRPPTLRPSPPPTAKPTSPACKDVLRSDVLLMLDSSASIDDREWQHFMRFHNKVLDDFPIAEGGMHVGIAQFASKTASVSKLTGDKAKLLQANKDDMHPRGECAGCLGTNTRMDKAVDAAMMEFKRSGRKDANNVLVMITDGVPTGGSAPGSMADKAFIRAKQAGIQVVFVLIGTIFRWLPLPKHWYAKDAPPIVIDNFAALKVARVRRRSDLQDIVTDPASGKNLHPSDPPSNPCCHISSQNFGPHGGAYSGADDHADRASNPQADVHP